MQDRINTDTRRVRVTAGRDVVDIDVSGVKYIEVYGHKTVLHTVKGEVAISQSLSALEERLGGDPFLRCYRYFIVNMDFVKRLNEESFLMKDGQEIPLSRDGRAALKTDTWLMCSGGWRDEDGSDLIGIYHLCDRGGHDDGVLPPCDPRQPAQAAAGAGAP